MALKHIQLSTGIYCHNILSTHRAQNPIRKIIALSYSITRDTHGKDSQNMAETPTPRAEGSQ